MSTFRDHALLHGFAVQVDVEAFDLDLLADSQPNKNIAISACILAETAKPALKPNHHDPAFDDLSAFTVS